MGSEGLANPEAKGAGGTAASREASDRSAGRTVAPPARGSSPGKRESFRAAFDGSGRVFVFRRACSVQAGGAHLLQVRKSAPQPSDGGDRAEPAGGPTRRPNVRPGGLRLTQGRPKRGVNETARGRRQGTQSRMFLKQH